ncbi:Anaphase-promoting complex subunit 5 [Exophiala dermatitidis]
MNRFLTPGKVVLLVVALLYAEDVVPTAQTTSILTFLMRHVIPINKESSTTDTNAECDHALPISAFEWALSTLPSSRPGRSLYDLLLKRLWMIDCFHAFEAFITNLPCLLAKTREQILREREADDDSEISENLVHGRILRTSPLGAFIRRCYLEYTRLQFQCSIALWQSFILYRLPTWQSYEKKNIVHEASALDVSLDSLRIDPSHQLAQLVYGRLAEEGSNHQGAFSTYDLEKLMEFQVSELQRMGGRLPDSMKSKLQQLAKSSNVIPKLGYYLRFLDSWRAGDYYSAFENLRRYFDYAMQSRERALYQYALLNLAILQADFDCYNEALPAMQEAIATARENRDVTCLNYCMSWLYHFGRSFPNKLSTKEGKGILGNEVEGLAFLKSRAKDAEMWSLLSTTLLSEAKLGLQYGDNLAVVFENIAKASHLNTIRSTHSITGSTLLMKGAAYSRVGIAHLAWLCGQAFLQCHIKEAPVEDILKCNCRMAGLLVQRGRYRAADEVLDGIPIHVRRVAKFQNYLNFYHGLLKSRRFLHRDDLNAAEHLLVRLRGQAPPDAEIRFSLSLLEVELLIRCGNFSGALQNIEALTKRKHHEISDIAVQTRLLNLKARVLAECGHPLKGFSLVMKAAQIAYRGRILPLLWESIGLLGRILNELREFAAASEMLESIMPQVLSNEDCDLTARSFSILADAYMGMAGLEEDRPNKRKEFISKTMENIDHAHLHFSRVEDLKGQLEMFEKKAILLHWRGDLVLANDVAAQYLELQRKYESEKV